MSTQELLMNLSCSTGVSGHKYMYSAEIEKAFKHYCQEVLVDNIGNVIGIKQSKISSPIKIMLAAHMDEIGLMVKDIDERGFISFVSIGGVDPRIFLFV